MRYICALTMFLIIVIMGLYKLGIIPFNVNKSDSQEIEAIITSKPDEKNYYNCYKIKYKTKKYYLYVKKDIEKFEIGDVVKINATYSEAKKQRNFKGFDYNIYLKSKNIHGIYKATYIRKIGKSEKIKIKIAKFMNDVRQKMTAIYKNNFSKDNLAVLEGLTIGDKSDINETITENFRNANLSHVLAISGAHLSYIILGISLIMKKLKNKRLSQFITIVCVMFFVVLTGMSASVTRAGLMCIIPIIASILKRKNDFYTTMCLSILIQIFINPYVIFDIGFILSYAGVLGIVIFYKTIYMKIHLKITSVAISANIVLIPIMAYYFNTISISFLFSNFIASIVLGPIIILGYLSTIFRFKIIFVLINILISILLKSTKFFADLTFLRANIITPSFISIAIYYYILYIILKFEKYQSNDDEIENKNKFKFKNIFENTKYMNYLIKAKREPKIKNKMNKLEVKANQKRFKHNKKTRILIIILIIVQIISNINFTIFDKNNLYINFIDVGQGDCTLIRYKNTNIMIDSGGSDDNNDYDVGQNVLMRNLLSKKIRKLDYIVISHFDADHCQGFMYLLKNFKIKNAIICRQAENSRYYEELLKISKEKKINIIYVKRGEKISINKINFFILNPNNEDSFINKNAMNNNAVVCKLVFYNFSALFTGDIEREAEDDITKTYKSSNILKSDILKVAHHGSKTSSTEEFLDLVKPRMALIGVGENNKFGHPNKTTIEKLNKRKVKIYRTDLNGEICIKVNKKGKIKVRTII